ncbi:hypothetical protein D9757_000226 [Collybiopsis confluens]|uniref:Uncharacterized protein n=1 Tax=Collybiopsis confluens TaxID=2823264 RepID=A0A8H5MHP6_9AGAR|nr:hypothetical protein D9757_000226 [Collybiopsis confluens]
MTSSSGPSRKSHDMSVPSDSPKQDRSGIPRTIWTDEEGKFHLNVPSRLLIVPGVAFMVGATIGLVREGRATSLRFLAENAHRPPRTVKGWYFYNKTKNYRVLLGGLKGAARESGKLVAISLGWVGVEEGLRTLGGPWNEVKEVGAGLGTAGLFCGVYRLGWRTTKQTVLLGGVIGGILKLLDSAKRLLRSVDNNEDTPQ